MLMYLFQLLCNFFLGAAKSGSEKARSVMESTRSALESRREAAAARRATKGVESASSSRAPNLDVVEAHDEETQKFAVANAELIHNAKPTEHNSLLKSRVMALLEWWKNSRAARMVARYGVSNGALLSSGMALTALLSLVAFLASALTLAVAVLGSNPELNTAFVNSIDQSVPGLLKTANHPNGILELDSLVKAEGTILTGVIAFLVATWGAVSCIASLGRSIRLIFGLPFPAKGLGGPQARAAIGMLLLPLLIVLASTLGLVTQMATDWLFPQLGITGLIPRLVTQALSIALSLLSYGLFAVVLIRVVAGVRPPKRDLMAAVGIIAIGSFLLRTLGMTIIQMNSNPLMAAATAIITVILWLGFQVQIILWACAWAVNSPAAPTPTGDAFHDDERPNYVTLSAPHTLEWPHNPVTGAPLLTTAEATGETTT